MTACWRMSFCSVSMLIAYCQYRPVTVVCQAILNGLIVIFHRQFSGCVMHYTRSCSSPSNGLPCQSLHATVSVLTHRLQRPCPRLTAYFAYWPRFDTIHWPRYEAIPYIHEPISSYVSMLAASRTRATRSLRLWPEFAGDGVGGCPLSLTPFK